MPLSASGADSASLRRVVRHLRYTCVMLHQDTHWQGKHGGDPMPAHNLGDRRAITTRVPSELLDTLNDARVAAHVTTMSQYVADVLAQHVGRPELIRELGRKEEGLLSA